MTPVLPERIYPEENTPHQANLPQSNSPHHHREKEHRAGSGSEATKQETLKLLFSSQKLPSDSSLRLHPKPALLW